MKKETYANKLFAMLGLEQEAQKHGVSTNSSKSSSGSHGNIKGITEEDIQNFRAAQAVTYFLQAPELFSAKVCPHCEETFLVSRQFVAFCSYTCIRKDLEAKGLEWRKGKDIDVIVKEVFDGNEPLWITPVMVERLKQVLDSPQESLLSRPNTSPQEQSISSTTKDSENESSSVLTTT